MLSMLLPIGAGLGLLGMSSYLCSPPKRTEHDCYSVSPPSTENEYGKPMIKPEFLMVPDTREWDEKYADEFLEDRIYPYSEGMTVPPRPVNRDYCLPENESFSLLISSRMIDKGQNYQDVGLSFEIDIKGILTTAVRKKYYFFKDIGGGMDTVLTFVPSSCQDSTGFPLEGLGHPKVLKIEDIEITEKTDEC